MNSMRRKNRIRWVILSCTVVWLVLLVISIRFVVGEDTSLKSIIQVEAGSESCDPTDFLKDGETADEIFFISGIDEVNFYVPGSYQVILFYNNKNYNGTIEVVDTTSPKGVSQDISIWLGDSVEPEDLVKSIDDVTEVTVTWEAAPDLEKEGDQSVSILLTDAGGNTQKLSATLTVNVDREPPEILGAVDQEITLGDSVSYRSGVTVTDNKDDQVELTIDNSQVNLSEAGSYPVVYTATDKAGNQSTVTVTIVVRGATQTKVIELADELLAQITTPEMTNKEKCRAIYTWAQNTIKYVGTADKSDIYEGAYEGFTKLKGDCYTYYAVATVLLDRLGIPNMKVERIDSTHYWCLVDAGEGWYHFDCSPRRIGHYVDTCLVPDSVLEKYSREEIEGYYDFDHSLYPERGE